ncbi:lysosomal alpha-glucosidase-like [Ixodes scapularis]
MAFRTRGCCFEPINATLESLEPGFILPPVCFYPANYLGYKVESIGRTPTRTSVRLKRVTPSGLPDDIDQLQADVIHYSDNTARIRIYDPRMSRYEVPLPNVANQEFYFPVMYETSVSKSGDIEIIRPTSRKLVFHTNLSTLVYADQFLQLSTYIPSRYVYGVGDAKSPLLRSTDWQKITLFNAGRSPTARTSTFKISEGKNLYSSHPFMLIHEETGESCGLFLLNSNAMDIVLKPSPSVTLRSTGGIVDLFVFMGPSPEAVVQQYTALVGRPFMPPYWALGFHLSRWGYNSIDDVKETRKRNLKAGLPIEAIWLDADYMENLKPFTYDRGRFAGLPEFAQDLHKRDMKFILTVHPGIDANLEKGSYLPFDEGHRMAVFVRSESGDYNYGMVGNRSRLVFPDFTHPLSGDYWSRMISYFHDVVSFDGLWLDLNEPSSLYNGSERGCPSSVLEEPPYVPGEGREALRTKTLCMSGRQFLSRHYNLHNLYGYTQTLRTYDSLRQVTLRRPFIISRSTFSGQGRYSGHWSGDIESDWDSLRSSISWHQVPPIPLQNGFGARFHNEAIWLDADYMENLKPFTYDRGRFAGLPEFAQDLHKRDMKFILTVHPGIDANLEKGSYLPFDEGHRMAVFVRSESGDYNYGMVGNRSRLVFPDFTHPLSGDYWSRMISYFHDVVSFDGLWLDLNEPSSLYNGSERGCPSSVLEEPPYVPGEGREALRTKTLCMSGRQFLSRHYNLHNLYGYTQTLRTYDSLRQVTLRRPFIISRSTFSGQGRYSGHWSGDIESDWDSLRSSISSMLTFNILGVPLTGSDICGFWDNTTVELCNRWHALGAFYPFARNHNAKGNIDQDPVAMGNQVVATAKKTLKIRYCFLPYLYTLFYRSHAFGDTVARPLFFEAGTCVAAAMLTFNILGVPLTGSDICGFWDNTTVELCNRWHALGAFYPFARNHNAKGNIESLEAHPATEPAEAKILYEVLPDISERGTQGTELVAAVDSTEGAAANSDTLLANQAPPQEETAADTVDLSKMDDLPEFPPLGPYPPTDPQDKPRKADQKWKGGLSKIGRFSPMPRIPPDDRRRPDPS